jgi:soluble lytic murein transglycosylase-like protein
MILLFSICLVFTQQYQLTDFQRSIICKYEKNIEKQAKSNKLDPVLIASVMFVESSFYPRVVSHAGACGLMQVIPKYTGGPETRHKKYSCKQLKNPNISIRVGTQILSYMIYKYAKGNVNQAICMYNAGTICLKDKRFYKKLHYVKKVRKHHEKIINSR